MKKYLILSFIFLTMTLNSHAQTTYYSLRPYKIINDTLLSLLDDYLFSEDILPNRQLSIYIDKHDSIVDVEMYIRTYAGYSLYCNLKVPPLGYIRYRNRNLILFSNVEKGYFEPDKTRKRIQIPCKHLLPFDGYVGWRFSINQKTGEVSLLEHITGW